MKRHFLVSKFLFLMVAIGGNDLLYAAEGDLAGAALKAGEASTEKISTEIGGGAAARAAEEATASAEKGLTSDAATDVENLGVKAPDAMRNITPIKDYIKPIRAISWEGASYYADESLDVVFIDAAHDYESVTKDLKAWYPKVKKGGVFAGHDYRQDCGVFDAVNDFFKGRHTVTKKGPCWVVAIGKPVTFESYRDLKGYVINLNRERWRYDFARKELTGLGFTNIHRWEATDYHTEDVVTEMRTLGASRLDRFYNCAEMSCLLSHFRAIHDFLTGTDPHCLIFEDDVVAVPDFKDKRDFHDIQWGDFDLLSFGGPFARWTLNQSPLLR